MGQLWDRDRRANRDCSFGKRLGGLSNVVGWISLLGIPSVIIWGLFIDETQGLSLEAASLEMLVPPAEPLQVGSGEG